MSFIDLATLTMHRRAEMEGRINNFDQKCDHAIRDIKKLQTLAHSFMSELNCEPAELKERFLNVMKKLDEYTYLISDFNLALGQIEEIGSSNITEYTPVQDSPVPLLPPTFRFNTNNLMDALSEPTPTTSCACSNLCPPEKPKRVKVPKEDQVLISFSSSTSSESVPNRKSDVVANESQNSSDSTEEQSGGECSPASPDTCNLPEQTLLQVDHTYRGVIVSLTGAHFSIITDDCRELTELMQDITEHYSKQDSPALSIDQARSVSYFAFYDQETSLYYRALNVREEQDEPDTIKVFLVDTGEIYSSPLRCLQPLAPCFCNLPPFARHCHLAGIELDIYNDMDLMEKYESFMAEYLNSSCTFLVDENASESIGVYVTLESGEQLHNILIQRGLATPIDKSSTEKELTEYELYSPKPADIAGCSPANVALTTSPAKADMACQANVAMAFSPIPVDKARCQAIVAMPQSPVSPEITKQQAVSHSPASPDMARWQADMARWQANMAMLHSAVPADMVRYQADVAMKQADMASQSKIGVPYYQLPAAETTQSPPEIVGSELDYAGPEYDDPVEAVTGYSNRDEEDICKHYKGGPNKTCFKGSRCPKKHIVKHPDGWTLDKVEVVGKIRSVPLPAPGTWFKAQVTCVAHFDRVYVNVLDEKQKDEVPKFGVILPPTTLSSLVRDMNSAASRASYTLLQFPPAPGEIVAAIYPPDNMWYRARVISLTRPDQSVELQYIDYGTILCVREDQIRKLEPRCAELPAQAIRCLLAGVHMTSQDSVHWARAKRALTDMTLDRKMHAHVIARDLDEITVELLDSEGYSVCEQLAALGVVQLREYSLCDDAHVTQRVVVP